MQQLQPATALPFIQNFQFNDKSNLTERWKIKLKVIEAGDDILQLLIPAFIPKQSISAPAHTASVICTITAAACALADGAASASFTSTFTIPYTMAQLPPQVIELPIAMPPGSLVIMAVALKYVLLIKGSFIPATNIVLMPCGIVAAMYV